ncbi:MAG: hypothetical protein M1839_001318 [Geoglossum umbratile]|nr:MAG: hypothetical protein M1839_001318 [Geoglossum umbratile]
MSVIIEEGTLTLKDGTSLYTKTWRPAAGTPTKARAVLLHGFSDHCDSYGIFSSTLASRGIEVHSYDQRGWGKTVKKPEERARGGSTAVILDDLTQFLEPLLPAASTTPLFLCGHSMGGGIVLTYAALGPPATLAQLTGYVVWSPLLQLHAPYAPSRPASFLLSLAARIFPNLTIPQKLAPEVVSRDPEVQKQFAEDKLNYPFGTTEGLWGMVERGKRLVDGAVAVDGGRSVWVGHGTGDRLTSWEASRKWVEGVFEGEDKVLKSYEGFRHKLHEEPGEDKITFANDVADWILARTPAPAAAAADEDAAVKPEPKSKL